MPVTHTDAFADIEIDDFETTDALRYGKVRTARRRIAEGWYERDGVLDTVLETIIQDMTPRR
jgi:hypothetical protein